MADVFDFYVKDNRTIQFNLTEPIMLEDSHVSDWVFHIPRVLNNIDMSGWAWWLVYINARGQKYSELLELSEDPESPLEKCIATYSVDYGMSIRAGVVRFSLEAINADTQGTILNEWHTQTYQAKVQDTLQGNHVEFAETESDIISALIIEVQNKVAQLVGGATPLSVNLKSLMTDHDKVYLYTGSEDGESTGYWYHWNGTDFVPGGLYASGLTIDPTFTVRGSVADAKMTGDALASKVAKPITSPNGTNGQILRTLGNGQTEWVDVGTPTDAQVGTAVESWLDDHPEATTTVQDGSLTEAKFSDALKLKAIKDYVTPEMFGAVGDGVTDDTQAIKDMFASNAKKFVFLHDTYRVTGGINVDIENCVVDFYGKTSLILRTNDDVRDFDYVIGFMALRIKTLGELFVNCNRSANVGIWLSQCAHSHFSHLTVNYARVWGVCTDMAHASLGSLHFDYLEAYACGYMINAVGICTQRDIMTITGMSTNVNFTDAAVRSMFDYSKFKSTAYIVDDSNFQDSSYYDMFDTHIVGSRIAWGTRTGIVLDSEDVSKGTFTVNYGVLPTAFVSDSDATVGRNIFIPIGGGILLKPSGSEGLCDIDKVSTMRCPIGLSYDFQYGGTIRNLASQFDTIVMESIALALNISYMYAEAIGNGFQITDKFKRIILLAQNSNPRVYVMNPFVGNGNVPFYQENCVICQNLASLAYTSDSSLYCPTYLAEKKLNAINAKGSAAFSIIVTENSPRQYSIEVPAFNASVKTITLDLEDLNAKHINRFSPFELYAHALNADGGKVSVTLSNNLITAGYAIHGAVDNVLSISANDYNKSFKVSVVLHNKTFYITAEALTFVDNTVQNT